MKARKSTLLNILTFIGLTQLNAQDPFMSDPSIPIWPTSQGGEYWAVQSEPCRRDATPWYLGGNNVPYFYRPISDIGTCNDAPFVLKAFNRQSVFLLQNSRLGIGYGNFSPAAAVDIKNSDPGNDPNQESHFRIYGDAVGNVESTTDINMTFASGKDLNFNEGSATSNTPRMSVLSGGRVVVGPSYFAANANYKLDVYTAGTSNDGINLTAQNPATKAYNVFDANSLLNNFTVFGDGKTVIGNMTQTTGNHTNAMLTVNGKAVAKEIYVTIQNWADYVFDKNYNLPKLSEVEAFYKKNHHLPEIPSATEVEKDGVNVAEMNKLLLQKIEELTIYLVEQQKQIDALKK